MSRLLVAAVVLAALPCGALPSAAQAQDATYKIGASVGLTGYAAANDRLWRDGLNVAADVLNAKGGILGRKIEIITEDNRSEPQEAVVGYRKMISSDQVKIFASGCVSAGNFAAASSVVRAQIPMVLCSILPRQPEEQKWAFSTLAPPRFEVEARYQYLKEKTQVRKIGILHDPTPYALLTKDIGAKIAAEFGLEVVGVETYKPDDADLSVQIGRLNAAGAGAIVKMGQGGSTVTAAKNVKSLGLDKMLLLASIDNVTVFRGAGESLGARFLFVAPGVQLPDALTDPAAKAAVDTFLKAWTAKYPDADPYAAARAYDTMMIIANAVAAAKTDAGPAVRDAIEKLPTYQGAAAAYSFSAEQHVGIVKNPFFIGTVAGGDKLVLAR
ncbi:MAG TPA: ABC transporter substrate-binding protein [Xanthobacteraceae bacterium]|nr:ABC transporter substrate-binding protein [Xanthobacteraceae bacterium]